MESNLPQAVDCPVPPSKSLLQRSLLACAWSGQPVHWTWPSAATLWSAAGLDVEELATLLSAAGWSRTLVPADSDGGFGGWLGQARGWSNLGPVDWQLGESGTSARLLLAALAFAGRSGQPRTLRVAGTLQARSSAALLQALEEAGVPIQTPTHAPWPVSLESRETPRSFCLRAPRSSQEVSALLFALAGGQGGSLEVQGPVPSWPYVGMTGRVLSAFGASIQAQPMGVDLLGGAPNAPEDWMTWSQAPGSGLGFLVTPWRPRSEPIDWPVEPDASAAAVAWSAGLLAGQPVRIPGWPADGWQGDRAFLDYVRAAGAQTARDRDGGLTVWGTLEQGWDLDLGGQPDLAPPLAALAGALAAGHFGAPQATILRGIGGLETKESPRLSGLQALLSQLGLSVQRTPDSLTVAPSPKP